jgi:hypothetical protein
VQVVNTLIEFGFPIDSPKDNGITPLGIASYRGNTSMMDRLVTAGADPHFLNKQGIGALYLALKGDKFDSVKYLLNKKVKIYNDDSNQLDNSPVFMAVK